MSLSRHFTRRLSHTGPEDAQSPVQPMILGSGEDNSDPTARRDRAAIAAQACQTCRSRKSKCDEKRPRCGLCTRLGVECVYREPQPTKKDKTLVHILQVLERLELKVDRVASGRVQDGGSDAELDATARSSRAALERMEQDLHDDRQRALESYLPTNTEVVSRASHITASHRVFTWPSVYLLLTNARPSLMDDLNSILQQGSSWFTRLEMEKHPSSLPGASPDSMTLAPLQPARSVNTSIAGLTMDSIRQLSDSYFDTFNIMHPILDRDMFYADVIGPLIRDGSSFQETSSCLAMMVLALGQVAVEGLAGQPITTNNGYSSGLRGGSRIAPPGLEIFNEARKRFGFVQSECSLQNVQIYILMGMYQETAGRHMDLWRCCASASMAFQVYIRCEKVDWASPKADLIRRVYWSCILLEDLYHHELDLPHTGIYSLEDKISLPTFQHNRYISATQTELTSFSHYHFLAMIALRRLISRIHVSLHPDTDNKAENGQDYGGPPLHMTKELARQLESWRTFLPQPLQWSDKDPFGHPNPNPLSRRQPAPLFSMEDLHHPDQHRYGLDILTAYLRTRFYYCRYLIYRPFVFKALHFPEAMTEEDSAYCAIAMQSACMWPLAMAPCKNKKRLVPYLFTWTQAFVGILLLLRLSTESECLRRICEERVSTRDIQSTVDLLLDWVRDLRSIDSIAEWSWPILESLYSLSG